VAPAQKITLIQERGVLRWTEEPGHELEVVGKKPGAGVGHAEEDVDSRDLVGSPEEGHRPERHLVAGTDGENPREHQHTQRRRFTP